MKKVGYTKSGAQKSGAGGRKRLKTDSQNIKRRILKYSEDITQEFNL